MARIDYGQVPPLKKPSFKNVRLIKGSNGKKHCVHLKYIDNKYINSPNRVYAGFSLVGQNKETGCWRLLQTWGKW